MTIACTLKESTSVTPSAFHPDTDFIKSLTIGALHTDMTLIMVCVITRQTVQRETIVRVTGDVKVKLSKTHERCLPLPVEAWLSTAISTAALLRTRPTPTSKMRRS